jgi:hypothetical protein
MQKAQVEQHCLSVFDFGAWWLQPSVAASVFAFRQQSAFSIGTAARAGTAASAI